MAEPINRDVVWDVDCLVSKEPCVSWGIHGRHLANIVERSKSQPVATIIMATCLLYLDMQAVGLTHNCLKDAVLRTRP